ncbi:hypothetical protein BXA18_22430, partial [Acinetobacter baumannii]
CLMMATLYPAILCRASTNDHQFEKDVMAYFAEIFQIPFEESWGYVTNGGTEGHGNTTVIEFGFRQAGMPTA